MISKGDTVAYVGSFYRALKSNGTVLKIDENGVLVQFTFTEYFPFEDLEVVSTQQNDYFEEGKRYAERTLRTLKTYYPWNDTMIKRFEWLSAQFA